MVIVCNNGQQSDMNDFPVFETASWTARQCPDCAVPGYLVLFPMQPVTSFSDIAPDAWQDLGTAMLLACRAVEEVINPERVYVARFSEGGHEIHFHIFPRTHWLKEEYRQATDNPDDPVSGPLLLQWARVAFREDPAQRAGISVQDAIDQLRQRVERIRTADCTRFK